MKIKQITLKKEIKNLVDISVENDHTFYVSDKKDGTFFLTHNSYPDIDNDWSDREQAVKLIADYFGEENVIPVSTFSQLQLRSLIKDLARLNGIPHEEVNAYTSKIEQEVLKVKKQEDGFDRGTWVLTYEEAEKFSPSFIEFIGKYPEFENSLKVLFKQMRGIGRHAGGVIITDNPADNLPLIIGGKKDKRAPQTPWPEGVNFRHLEDHGFLKFDILSIGTLRLFEECIRKILIKEGNPNPSFSDIKQFFIDKLHPDNNPMTDVNVYKNVFWDGRYCGIFQFVKPNTQKFMREMKPASILDIAIATSVFRPGPLSLGIDRLFLKNKKNPEKVQYKHELLREIFQDTAGLLIFQEQLQMVYNKLCDVPLDETDKVRKAFTKKDISNKEKAKAEREALKTNFITLCKEKNDINEKISSDLFDEMEKLVAYSFNKSVLETEKVSVYSKEGLFLEDKEIKDVKPGEFVRSRDETTQQDIFISVKANHDHGLLPLVEITLENGEKIRCTLEHKFRTVCGQMLPLKEILKNGMEIVVNDKKNDVSIVKKNMGNIILTQEVEPGLTRDLEVDHPDHQYYLANGVLTSNSHAIAYAITTWQCAWFFTYYPDEWITTYLDYCAIEKGDSTGQEDPKAVAMKEAKSLGYKFSKPDINFSHYTTVMHPTIPKTIIPSFSAMKGLGEAGVYEILQNRPYQNLLDLLVDKNTGNWKHSKFNKRGIETLIKLEALDSLNAVGENGVVKTYKELDALVIGNYDKLKKTTERKKNRDIEPLIKQFASEISGKLGDWTDKEKIQMQQELYGSVDFSLIVPEKILEELATLGYDCVDTWEEKGNYWAVISSVTEAVTKTTGKPFLKLKIYGKSLKEYPCSIWNIKSGKTLLSQNDLIVGKFDKNDYGFSTSVNQIQKLNQ